MYRRILVPLDGSQEAELAVHYAEDLAHIHQADLILLYLVAPTVAVDDSELPPIDSAARQNDLFTLQGQLFEAGFRVQVQVVEKYAPQTTVLKLIEAEQPDLMLMAARGRTSMLRWVFGKEVEQGIDKLPIPLLVVRPTLQTIIVPLDGSTWSERAVPKAAEIARLHQAEIVLLHVYQSSTSSYNDQIALAGQQQIADQNYEQIHDQLIALRNLLRREGLRAREHMIRSGNPAQTIIEFVEAESGLCMVIMSTHGRTRLARLLLGSVAQKVIKNLRCPVTLVRPDEE
ncbi:MAG TPA: universal stress protein [Aggregatilineaceae bacterium]|nr:universal stress protein [Aggregatilineaceae bacterium]